MYGTNQMTKYILNDKEKMKSLKPLANEIKTSDVGFQTMFYKSKAQNQSQQLDSTRSGFLQKTDSQPDLDPY